MKWTDKLELLPVYNTKRKKKKHRCTLFIYIMIGLYKKISVVSLLKKKKERKKKKNTKEKRNERNIVFSQHDNNRILYYEQAYFFLVLDLYWN